MPSRFLSALLRRAIHLYGASRTGRFAIVRRILAFYIDFNTDPSQAIYQIGISANDGDYDKQHQDLHERLRKPQYVVRSRKHLSFPLFASRRLLLCATGAALRLNLDHYKSCAGLNRIS